MVPPGLADARLQPPQARQALGDRVDRQADCCGSDWHMRDIFDLFIWTTNPPFHDIYPEC